MTARESGAHRNDLGEIELAPPPTILRPRQSDEEIARAVRRTLDNDPSVPAARIRCSVSDGLVTLEGTVDFWSEREAAGYVRNLEGVRGVSNRLQVIHTSVDDLPSSHAA